ncbi:Pseudouridine synthase family protein [Thalictrum thalictroides]|uniref:tRNA pseudouridine synthase n=1 Tax=Thalictrum thalictroides TaxID=46969 RepID=A0A7J6UV64_THATH|nr:Pseudouridine synthase family protein [Thalictrum thalictroides]
MKQKKKKTAKRKFIYITTTLIPAIPLDGLEGRECHEFMYERPWQQVNDFYSRLVNGGLSLSASLLFQDERALSKETCDNDITEVSEETELKGGRTGRWDRVTFKILLSYHGNSFDGWQKQPGLNTVQGIVERSVGSFVDERKAQKLNDLGLPLEGCTVVAGRTDKGVTALKQVCSFYTWRKDVKAQDVEDSINKAAPGKLRVISATKVSRDFHPNFSAKWRHYFYIFPLNDEGGELCSELGVENENHYCNENYRKWINGSDTHLGEEKGEYIAYDDTAQSGKKPRSFSAHKVNQLLLPLQGRSLSYKMFARDTKASRSTGPPTECIIYHARAAEAWLPCDNEVPGKGGKRLKVMCVELVANRFLRRMVRVLVATLIREAAAGADNDALLKLMDATCRRATAPPAPPDGLCLVDVGYKEFNPEDCIIP